MSFMKYDITFCGNRHCPKREKCERNSDRTKDYPYHVSMAGFAPDEKTGICEFFVSIETPRICGYCKHTVGSPIVQEVVYCKVKGKDVDPDCKKVCKHWKDGTK